MLPRPQNWFQEILNNRAFDHWWKENFRIERETFEAICGLLGPAICRQDTRLKKSIPVEKRVAVALRRLATGECYRSCGLMFGLSKASAVYSTHEFVEELCNFKNQFIKFPNSRAELQRKD